MTTLHISCWIYDANPQSATVQQISTAETQGRFLCMLTVKLIKFCAVHIYPKLMPVGAVWYYSLSQINTLLIINKINIILFH